MQVLTRSPVRPCRSCGRPRSRRKQRRGLCRRCYRDRAVRQRHPYTGTLAGLTGPIWTQDFDGEAPQPPPTDAEPGTPQKVLAIHARARRKQALFRPDEPAHPLRDAAMHPRFAWLWQLLIEADPTIADALRELAEEAQHEAHDRIDTGGGRRIDRTKRDPRGAPDNWFTHEFHSQQ